MLGGFFVIRYDILDIAAQRSLDGGLVFCLHLNDVRYDTDDALFFFLLLHDLFDATTITIIALGNIGQGF